MLRSNVQITTSSLCSPSSTPLPCPPVVGECTLQIKKLWSFLYCSQLSIRNVTCNFITAEPVITLAATTMPEEKDFLQPQQPVIKEAIGVAFEVTTMENIKLTYYLPSCNSIE